MVNSTLPRYPGLALFHVSGRNSGAILLMEETERHFAPRHLQVGWIHKPVGACQTRKLLSIGGLQIEMTKEQQGERTKCDCRSVGASLGQAVLPKSERISRENRLGYLPEFKMKNSVKRAADGKRQREQRARLLARFSSSVSVESRGGQWRNTTKREIAKPVAAPIKTSDGKCAPVVTREKLSAVASVYATTGTHLWCR